MQSQLNKYVVQLDARIETKGSKSTKSFLKLFNLAPFLEGSVKLTFYEFVAAKSTQELSFLMLENSKFDCEKGLQLSKNVDENLIVSDY